MQPQDFTSSRCRALSICRLVLVEYCKLLLDAPCGHRTLHWMSYEWRCCARCWFHTGLWWLTVQLCCVTAVVSVTYLCFPRTGAAVTDEPGVLGYCYALYDYLALEPTQLSLRRGDRVAVISKAGASRGWWKGRLHGKVSTTAFHPLHLRCLSTANVLTGFPTHTLRQKNGTSWFS